MTAILADYNLTGQILAVATYLEHGEWREFWHSLDPTVLTFACLGLDRQTPDDELWRLCQREGIVLVTGNRNDDDPTSLQAVIRAENHPDSLPVLTVADPTRVVRSRDYLARVAVSLLDHLLRIDDFRGTGRVYVP